MTGEVRELAVYRLGKIDYASAHALQERLLEARLQNEIGDVLLLLEHDPVITLGRGARRENVLCDREALRARGIEVFDTGRGGDVTYHGPGQLVAYPIFDLKPDRRDVRRYVWSLEEVMIRLAGACGLSADRVEGLNGVWIGARKIGAVGVRIKRWVTMHGLSFNVTTNLDPFDLIVPCGIRDRGVTSLQRELGLTIEMDEVIRTAAEKFEEVFQASAKWQEARDSFCHLG